MSKWENNSAIPELDKLLKISEIFGVTLDELVGRDAPTPPPQTAPPETAAPEIPTTPPYRTAGIILVSFGLLADLLLSILGGFYLGIMAGMPFVLIGCVLISSTEGLFFKSAWVIFAVYAPLCYYFILNFIGYGLYISIGVFSVWFAALIVIALELHRRGKLSADSRKLMIGSIVIALVLLILIGFGSTMLNYGHVS